MKERRQFYRIDDRVSLSYKLIPDKDIEQELFNAQRGYIELTDIKNSLSCIETRLEDISYQLSNDYPLISEMIMLVNKKISLHEQMMGFYHSDENRLKPATDVNLSANGVAFETKTPLSESTHLRLEMVIYPESHYIPIYGHVVSCKQISENPQDGYKMAVEFDAISDKDREKIIQHVLSKQADEIKNHRENQEQEKEAPPDSTVVKLIK